MLHLYQSASDIIVYRALLMRRVGTHLLVKVVDESVVDGTELYPTLILHGTVCSAYVRGNTPNVGGHQEQNFLIHGMCILHEAT